MLRPRTTRPRGEVEACGQRQQPAFNAINHDVWRRGPGGEANVMSADEPVWVKLIRRLHMMDLSTETAAGSHQFMRIVAMASANHNHHITSLGQFDRRMLPLLRR